MRNSQCPSTFDPRWHFSKCEKFAADVLKKRQKPTRHGRRGIWSLVVWLVLGTSAVIRGPASSKTPLLDRAQWLQGIHSPEQRTRYESQRTPKRSEKFSLRGRGLRRRSVVERRRRRRRPSPAKLIRRMEKRLRRNRSRTSWSPCPPFLRLQMGPRARPSRTGPVPDDGRGSGAALIHHSSDWRSWDVVCHDLRVYLHAVGLQ